MRELSAAIKCRKLCSSESCDQTQIIMHSTSQHSTTQWSKTRLVGLYLRRVGYKHRLELSTVLHFIVYLNIPIEDAPHWVSELFSLWSSSCHSHPSKKKLITVTQPNKSLSQSPRQKKKKRRKKKKPNTLPSPNKPLTLSSTQTLNTLTQPPNYVI